MSKKIARFGRNGAIILAVIVFVFVYSGVRTSFNQHTERETFIDREFVVSRVLDGDTIVVEDAEGVEEHVRLIGVNAPERGGLLNENACLGEESAKYLLSIIEIEDEVLIQLDESQDFRDVYDRVLAYVHLPGNDVSVNESMIRRGYALEYTHILPYERQSLFREAERSARNELRGLWSPGPCGDPIS